MQGFAFGHLAKHTPSIMKGIMDYLTTALPLRMAGMHIVNISPSAEKVVAIAKSLMKKKLANRVSRK